MLDNFPHAVRIKKIIKETPLVRSYFFDYSVRAKPGQFVNVWVTGIDEKPMSIAFDDGKSYMLSIAAIGDMTKALAKKKVGDYIGIRGPYGTHFSWKPRQRIAMLAGGYGAGPLYFATSLAVQQNCHVDFFLGARSKAHLLYTHRIKTLKRTRPSRSEAKSLMRPKGATFRFFPSTGDGAVGFHGSNVENWLLQMKKGAEYDLVLTCGPELMMKAVSDIAWKKKIDAQISVERYMKCGFGICGNCCIDDLGITTCQNGTVMPNSLARKLKEFGVYHRDSVGRKHPF